MDAKMDKDQSEQIVVRSMLGVVRAHAFAIAVRLTFFRTRL
jgi:hypothetical protein